MEPPVSLATVPAPSPEGVAAQVGEVEVARPCLPIPPLRRATMPPPSGRARFILSCTFLC